MKILITLCLFFYSINTVAAQQITTSETIGMVNCLVARNDKHTKSYSTGLVLKIHYFKHGQDKKAKGRLLIFDDHTIGVTPFDNSRSVMINIDSVISIGRWHRSSKISTLVVAGAGLLTAGALLITLEPQFTYVAFFYSYLLGLVTFTAVVYTGISTPIIYLSEWLSIRSVKNGYHFSVEKKRYVESSFSKYRHAQ